MPKKGETIVPDRYCKSCNKKLWKYTKPRNPQKQDLCKSCYKKVFPAKQWYCIDCGIEVGRKVKRCRACDSKFKQSSPTYQHTTEINAKISKSLRKSQKAKTFHESRIGKKHTSETIEKIKSAWDGQHREQAKLRGDKMAQDIQWLKKISIALAGENNPNWKNGLSQKPYAKGFCQKLKLMIRERDNFKCQLCDATEQDLGYTLSIHHIDYDKSNHSLENLISLCKRCNSLVNFDRDKWTDLFNHTIPHQQ